MTNGSNSGWTEARVSMLAELWATSRSPEVIAKELGGFDHTRDGGRKAVIGKANRMGLEPKRAKAVQPTAEELVALRLSRRERQVAREKARVRSRSKSGMPPRPKQEAKPKPEVKPFLGSIDIMFGELRAYRQQDSNECRFIDGDTAGTATIYCGNETRSGRSYCDHHHAKCHDPARPAAPVSAEERERRAASGKAVGFANVRAGRVVGHRLPAALFPVAEYPVSLQTAEAGA